MIRFVYANVLKNSSRLIIIRTHATQRLELILLQPGKSDRIRAVHPPKTPIAALKALIPVSNLSLPPLNP